jgi:tetratricopeptide (TPR) repeat protein
LVANGWIVLAGVWVGLGGLGSLTAQAQGSPAAAAPGKKVCTVNRSAPNAAETALDKGDFAPAESLFRELLAKNADDETAQEGLVRALIAQDKVDAAAKNAGAWVAAAPASSMAMVAQAEVLLRQGDPRGALLEFLKASQAEGCNARSYYGISKVYGLSGYHAAQKRFIEQAYALHPTDDEINIAWIDTRPRAERLEKLADYAEHSDQISDESRAKMKTSLAKASLYHPSDCRAAPTSPETATVPIWRITEGLFYVDGWGLEMKFNGKTRRLLIDTGASGITISRTAALFLGLKPEYETKVYDIGDEGLVNASIAHVASVKIGGIEFTNCAVAILEKSSDLDATDGVVGGDIFAGSQLTLDFPKNELRIAPLPQRPGEAKPQTTLDAAGNDDAEAWRDPYIAPEMAKWDRVYRSGRFLLMPTGIVDTKQTKDLSAWKNKLFILHSGVEINLISPAAAREVTNVSSAGAIGWLHTSGAVDQVYEAGRFTLEFAGLHLDSPGNDPAKGYSMTPSIDPTKWYSIDLTKWSHDAGVEVSGFIGAPELVHLVLHIDYRDNLVWCEYKDPK